MVYFDNIFCDKTSNREQIIAYKDKAFGVMGFLKSVVRFALILDKTNYATN